MPWLRLAYRIDSLSWFPSAKRVAYWGGAAINLPENCGTVGILIPLLEDAYGKPVQAEEGFTLHPLPCRQIKPSPYGPLLRVNGETVDFDLPKFIEFIGCAYQQLAPKLAAPFN